MRGHQIVICMVAVFATGGQQILVDVAIAAGVEILILSEFGPPSRDPKFAALQPALPPKVATVGLPPNERICYFLVCADSRCISRLGNEIGAFLVSMYKRKLRY